MIEHLKHVGVTAVELLPCQAFLSEDFLRRRGLKNYWGYNPVAWFAPCNEFAIHDAVAEFKTMVQALHRAGIEVILDVVFNHTAEGNESGPVLSFKGHRQFGRITACCRTSAATRTSTGCGNTVNCEHPQVRASIVDCLKYWVEEMHVDGFRFDLATVLGRDGSGFNERSEFFNAVRARAGAGVRQADRGALGRRARRLPVGPVSRRLGRMERPLPRHGARVLAPRRRAESANWPKGSPARATYSATTAASPPPASIS